jgi:hypothetical protein
MTRHPYVVQLKVPGVREVPGKTGRYFFHTTARSEAEALKIARKLHPGWHHVETRREIA